MYFTIFTPTFNRAYILKQAYDCLVKQKFTSFKWVIIDDGSIDDTCSLVSGWIKEDQINIVYEKQENQGRFMAFNTAVKYFEGELLVFLDSDDYLKDDALEKLYSCWEEQKTNGYSGIISNMVTPRGTVIGSAFPENLNCERICTLRNRYRVKGDKAVYISVDKVKDFRYPVIKGEKFIGDSLIMDQVCEAAPMYIWRNSIYVREYRSDGLTNNVISTWCNSPKGMTIYYNQSMHYIHDYKLRLFVFAMKYVCFAKMSKQTNIVSKSTRKAATALMYIPGLFYCKYLIYKCRK